MALDIRGDRAPVQHHVSSDDSDLLQVRILGPMEIRDSGEDCTPTAPMVRRLLAALLLHPNEQVRTSALIDELWCADPPRLARKTLQTYVYQLRRAPRTPTGGPGQRVETCPNGYLMRIGSGELDLWRFESSLARARTEFSGGDLEGCARTLRAGLALWRGDAFADITMGPALMSRVAQLQGARLSALELRIEADLRLGRHHRVLSELHELTCDHPLNEEFAADLMLAAYRAGRRCIALEAFGRLRRSLVNELGIEPSQRLQRLQHDVLNEAVSLELPPRWPAAPENGGPAAPVTGGACPVRREPIAQLPPDTPDFVGRRAELERILAHAAPAGAADRAAPRIVTVLGQAGAGKSAVAVRAAHMLRERFGDGQFHVRLHDENGRPKETAGVLRSLLCDIGLRARDLPVRTDELARMFRSWSADRRLLLVLDDADGADQVFPLLPGGSLSAVLVTSRVRLPGLPGAAAVKLGPMDTDDAVALLASLAGAGRIEAAPAAARETVRLTGNLALGVRAAGEKLLARPAWSVTELAVRLAPEHRRPVELSSASLDVRGRLTGAYHRLGASDAAALARLASAGSAQFGVAGAARVLGVDGWSTELLVDRLLNHHVLEVAAAKPGAATVYFIPTMIRLVARAQERASRPRELSGRG